MNKVRDSSAGLHPGFAHREDAVHCQKIIKLMAPEDEVALKVAELHEDIDPLMTNAQSEAVLNVADAIQALRKGDLDTILRQPRKRRYRLKYRSGRSKRLF